MGRVKEWEGVKGVGRGGGEGRGRVGWDERIGGSEGEMGRR